MELEETMWSPALQMLNRAKKLAAWPEPVSIPAVPPSSSVILAATVLQAGIKITAGLQVKQLAHIVGAIIFESGALHNGNLAGFAVAGGIAALYAQGIDAVFAGLIHDLTSFPQKR